MKVTGIFGWVGMILIISAYAMSSFNLLNFSSPAYQLLNLIGALGMVVSSFSKKDYPPAILNLFWMLIAFVSLVSLLI
ncbi:hypothetical protein GF360_03100 [candidate division WWE3 bacterium]|nr:hypothetical protein [candidate division WWE3 bacterium]